MFAGTPSVDFVARLSAAHQRTETVEESRPLTMGPSVLFVCVTLARGLVITPPQRPAAAPMKMRRRLIIRAAYFGAVVVLSRTVADPTGGT